MYTQLIQYVTSTYSHARRCLVIFSKLEESPLKYIDEVYLQLTTFEHERFLSKRL